MKEIKEKIKKYKENQVIFAKKDYKKSILLERKFTEEELKKDLLSLKGIKHIESEKGIYEGKEETRYKVYAVYSNGRGRFYSIRFNKHLKIITAHPLGRKTLNKWRKKNKRRQK